jgi:dihydrofolate reductase
MRKVVLFMHISLDGFCAGPNGELDWVSYDEELQKHAADIVSDVGTSMYGRVTYQMMENYWPTVLTDGKKHDKHTTEHAEWVENIPKVVFSKTLPKVTWNNTTLIKSNIAEEVSKLKMQPGKNLVIFGSPGLSHEFMEMDLIDEYQLTVSPVILGNGIPIFDKVKTTTKLNLIKSTTLKSGVVTLHYERKK